MEKVRKTNLATIIAETTFCFYFMGLDRTLIYQDGCLIMSLGDNAENSIILESNLDMDFDEFHETGKRMFITLLEDLHGN